MAIKVKIPTPLQKLTNNKSEVEIEKTNVKTIKELIKILDKKFPGIKERLCDEKGNIRRFINVYINDEDIRFLKKDETNIEDGDDISIIPAIAGGSYPIPLLYYFE